MNRQKRFDGKKKLVSFTKKMEADLRSFCRDKGIHNESELVRRAVSKYIYAGCKDEPLNPLAVKQIQDLLARCQITVSLK